MTRTARKQKKKHLEASSWKDMKQSVQEGRVSKKKGTKPLKEGIIKTLKESKDLVKVVNNNSTKSKTEKWTDKGMNKGRGGVIKGRRKSTRFVDQRTMLKREKRKLRRAKLKECFGCRKPGHKLEECPHKQKEHTTGICFKCGSSEHGINQCKVNLPPGTYPYAKCFICGEKGHLTRSCPDNPKGLYPHGGSCSYCGSVEHLKVNCPDKHSSKQDQQQSITLEFKSTNSSADADISDIPKPQKKQVKKKSKTVKFI